MVCLQLVQVSCARQSGLAIKSSWAMLGCVMQINPLRPFSQTESIYWRCWSREPVSFGMTTHGIVAWRMTYSLTLPMMARLTAPMPRLPSTINSAFSSSAMRQIISPGFLCESPRILKCNCNRVTITSNKFIANHVQIHIVPACSCNPVQYNITQYNRPYNV